MKNKILIIIAVLVLIGASSWYVSKKNNSGLSESETLGIAKSVALSERFTVHPLECLSWKELDHNESSVTWQATKQWDGNCPAYSPDAPGVPALRINRLDGSVMVQAIDGEFRNVK